MSHRLIIVPILAFILLSCKDAKLRNDRTSALSKKVNQEINVSDDLGQLIKSLDDSSTLEYERVGFVGRLSRSYQYFLELNKIATDSVLVALTNHPNPKMKMYGMWALVEKNRSLALQQFKRLKKDTSKITSISGCLMLTLPLNYMAAHLFDSTELPKGFVVKPF
ncbi:MAG: hypothetical protein EOP48_11655 [Sphingobacteriales bacterium]|nr:MAG: hypothetical protein EOP48_11655 [Sphingobacteriales bacterium]